VWCSDSGVVASLAWATVGDGAKWLEVAVAGGPGLPLLGNGPVGPKYGPDLGQVSVRPEKGRRGKICWGDRS
jgi:hypothetical protein